MADNIFNNKITGSKGGRWDQGKDNAIVFNTHNSSGSIYRPIGGSNSKTSVWTFGTLADEDNFYFYCNPSLDSDLSSGYSILLKNPTADSTIAYTSDIPTNYYSSTKTRNINTVLAGPSSGTADAATFRKLVADDIPSLNASKINNGKFPIERGGTGNNTATGNRLVWTDTDGKAYLTSKYHFADETHIAVNYNSMDQLIPSTNFLVNGTSRLTGDTKIEGNLTLYKKIIIASNNYGSIYPSEIGIPGELYFQTIG